jgi:predicted nucleic acid-binding Zn ribbon protein
LSPVPEERIRDSRREHSGVPRGPEPVGEILSRLFAARGWGRRQERLRLEEAWSEAAGPEIARHTRAGALRRGVLEIMVDSAVLLQELAHFQKRRLLEQLRRRLPSTTIADLRFRAGVVGPGNET